MDKYESTVRVVTAFFAALIGFGLKHILDYLDTFHIVGFLIAVFLFLRFITGSANHLWFEHVDNSADGSTVAFTLDVLFLVIFGISASLICYSSSIKEFFLRSGAFLIIPIAWGFITLLINCFSSWSPRSTKWGWWILIDLVHGVTFFIAWHFTPYTLSPDFSHYYFWIVLIISALCAIIDFYFIQLKILKNG